MKLSEIRDQLMSEHDGLRAEIARLRAEVEKGEGGSAGLGEALTRLAESLRTHNAHEESLMRNVLPTIDAWGPVRNEILLEEHEAEHGDIVSSLMVSLEQGPAASSAKVLAVLERLVAHMDREEKIFLGKELLSDDGGPIDSFGG